MKKLLSIAVSSLVLATTAGISPDIGVSAISVGEASNVIIPIKYKSLETGENVTADALVATNGLPSGTRLFVYLDNAYSAWTLLPTGWSGVDSSSTAVQGITPGTPAENQSIPLGNAIWIVFPGSEKPESVYIYGKYQATGLTSTIARGTVSTPVANLLCNPTAATVEGEALIMKLSGKASAKDVISPIGNSFTGNYIFNGTVWKHYYDDNGQMKIEPGVLPSIAAGQGFWYTSKGGEGSSFTIEW